MLKITVRSGVRLVSDGSRSRFGLAAGLAALHDGGTQASGEIFRQVVGFVAAIDVDGLAGCVDDNLAMVAGTEVLFDLGEQVGVDATVEIIG